jgi:hypothetical protein
MVGRLPPSPAQDEDVFKTGIRRGFVKWEPTCDGENCYLRHAANLLREVFRHTSFDADLMEALLDKPRAKTAEMLIWPHLNQGCQRLRRSIERQLERGLPDRSAALMKTLVFYRRHSGWLQYCLDSPLRVTFEGMCNYVLAFLRTAGYSGWKSNFP